MHQLRPEIAIPGVADLVVHPPPIAHVQGHTFRLSMLFERQHGRSVGFTIRDVDEPCENSSCPEQALKCRRNLRSPVLLERRLNNNLTRIWAVEHEPGGVDT